MNLLKYVMGLAVVTVLTACGGGGGNPGTSSGAPAVVMNKDPVLALALQDASGTATNSISSSGFTVLKATLTDPSGNPIPNQVVNVAVDVVTAGEVAKVVFPEGPTGLTNASGVATIKIARATLVSTGAGSLTATYSYKVGSFSIYPDGSVPPSADKVIAKYIGYQLSAANITLTGLDVGASTLAAYGTRQVSVQANINGIASATTPVQVSFSANCGQVSPAVASTNSAGIAFVSYTATDATGTVLSTQGCSGKTIEISASTLGAAVVTKSLNILAAPATNLSFVSVKPTRIFLAGSGGLTQAVVEFKLVNAREEPLLGQDVQLTMKTLNSGIPKASFGTVGNVNLIVLTTDSAGKVSVPVFSGTVPTSVVVNAALVSNPAVQTDSAVLTIASGRAAQARVSLSIKDFAIEGFNVDGVTTDVTLSLADRQGNPVPDGTAVNFVTEGGVMIPPVCYTGGVKDPVTGVFSSPGNSQCSVTIRSQAPRPANGRVSILAYVAGEEDFVDKNFNNVYDTGDTFTDLGNAFRDDNESNTFDAGEFSVPRTGAVSSGNGCPGLLGQPGTCDGVWGAADVRKQTIVVFATGAANIAGSFSSGSLFVTISDTNGNSMPTGSTVKAISTGSCELNGGLGLSVTIANSLGPFVISYATSAGCVTGDQIIVEVTTPLGTITTRSFTVFVASASFPLAVSSGSAMTVFVGDTRSSTVSGGTVPYSLSSSPASKLIATATLSGTNLQVTGVAPGTATISVTDALGFSYPITVTVTN